MREPVGSALDLGTGCGVQALHLAGHAGRVVATDVNSRALWMTRLNAELNGADVDVRDGSLFDRSGGELRPDRDQPAVRDLAGHRRAAGLPRLRPARRPGRRAHRAHRPATSPTVAGSRCSPTGRSSRAGRGTSGSARGCATTATRWSCSARPSTRRRTSSCGSRTPAPRRPGLGPCATTRGCRGSRPGLEGVGFGWITCGLGGTGRPPRAAPLALRRRAAHRCRRSTPGARAVDDLRGSHRRPAARPDPARPRRRAAGDGRPSGCGGSRGDRAAPAARLPAGICTADTVEAAFVGACDGNLTVGPLLGALASPLRARRRRPADDLPPRGARARRARGSSRSTPSQAPATADGRTARSSASERSRRSTRSRRTLAGEELKPTERP